MVAAVLPIMAKLSIIFNVRMCEHLGISARTGKRVKGDDDSAIKVNLLFCNHTPDFEDSQFLQPTTMTLKSH